MARKKKEPKVTDPFERVRLKKLRSAQRREERKKRRLEGGDDEAKSKPSSDYSKPMVKDDYLWIRKDMAVTYAQRIINDNRQRPYWLSIPHDYGDGVLPLPNFYPCTTFRTGDRAYFGFLFREHRDLFFLTLSNARKELTDKVRAINPSSV